MTLQSSKCVAMQSILGENSKDKGRFSMHKTLDSVYDNLMHIRPFEEVLRSYYQQYGDYCPYEKLMKHRDQFIKNDLLLSGVDESGYPLNELTELSISESRYILAGEDIAVLKHPRYLFPLEHRHSFFEILYVFSGSCINTIDGKIQKLGEGSICIIPPSVDHSIAVNEDAGLVLNFIVRSSTFNQSFTELLDSNDILATFFNEIIYSNKYRKYLLFHTGDALVLKNIALAMFDTYHSKGSYYNRIMNGYFMVLMGTLLQSNESTVEYPESYFEKYDIVPKLLDYIKNHAGSVTLEDCAKRFHFSQRYLGRLVKKATGFTFPQYLTHAKMEIAKKMLLQNDISLEKIATMLGYNDSSYFIRVFKKEFGRTPSDYRKME